MKRLFLVIFTSLVAAQWVNAQTIEHPKTTSIQTLHDNYVEKYKFYKTTGRVFLGAGIGMIVGGGIVYAKYAKQGYNGVAPVTAENFLFFIGPGTALTSIPFFFLARRNKRKAALLIKGESVEFGNKIPYTSNYLALTLTIKI